MLTTQGLGGRASALLTSGLGARHLHTNAYLSDTPIFNPSDLPLAGDPVEMFEPAMWHPRHTEVFNARSFIVTIGNCTESELTLFLQLLETIRPATATILVRNLSGGIIAKLFSPTEN